jgi:hypothetical protein
MDANQMTRDRRRLAGYARDPDQYDAAFADSTIASCLSRGAFFTQKGKTHMKDAVLEYKRVLFIDPDNERARANLARLGTESSNDTPARVAADRSETTDTATRLMPGAVPNSKASPRRGTSKRRLGALAVIGALGLSAIVWRIATLDRPVNGDNVPVAANESGPVRPSDASTLRADSLAPAGPTPGIQARDAMSASTSGAPEPLLTDSRDTPVRKPAADTSTKNRAERPAAGSDNTKPETKKTASVPTRRVSAPDTVAAPGLLSVFFLGGVGEVWIDGTLFPQQPPFERVSIPAGTHRIACRIGDDATLREMTVTIQPNRETVIEYEVGGKPIVVEE